MADYCRWGYAIAEAIGYGGQTFLDAYRRNISRANENALSEDPIAAAVVAFMRERSSWSGYVAKLLTELERVAEDEKINIAHRYLLPKQMKTNGLKKTELTVAESALRDIVRYYTREAGVRALEIGRAHV